MKNLTKKQQEVEDLLLKGLSCKQIALQLNINFNTIRSRKNEILKKRNASSITELLAIRFTEIMEENRQLKKCVEQLIPYKQKWEYLRERAFAERG